MSEPVCVLGHRLAEGRVLCPQCGLGKPPEATATRRIENSAPGKWKITRNPKQEATVALYIAGSVGAAALVGLVRYIYGVVG
jgi:hypothetical protein